MAGFASASFANSVGKPNIFLWRTMYYSLFQLSAPRWKELTRLPRSLWEPHEICGLKGFLISLIMSLDKFKQSLLFFMCRATSSNSEALIFPICRFTASSSIAKSVQCQHRYWKSFVQVQISPASSDYFLPDLYIIKCLHIM